MNLLTSIGFGLSGCRREYARRRCARIAARRATRRAAEIERFCRMAEGVAESALRCTISRLPMTTISKLLKSCAPPVSCPIASNCPGWAPNLAQCGPDQQSRFRVASRLHARRRRIQCNPRRFRLVRNSDTINPAELTVMPKQSIAQLKSLLSFKMSVVCGPPTLPVVRMNGLGPPILKLCLAGTPSKFEPMPHRKRLSVPET